MKSFYYLAILILLTFILFLNPFYSLANNKSFNELKKEASLGIIDSQFELGYCYEYGIGVEQNYVEAIKWYMEAAEKGHASAQNNLGNIYLEGHSVGQDFTEAVKWFRKAAEQGEAPSQFNLGWCYYMGQGVTQDYIEAVKWWIKSAEKGNSSAQANLGILYQKGQGVTQDYTEAVKWFQKAASQGEVAAQFNLGWCYFKGQGIPQDYNETIKWWTKAGEQGQAEAQNNLGLIYQKGQVVAQDYTEAVKWFKLAAEQGNADAQKNLGICYEAGRGVESDLNEAIKWWRLSALQGNAYAKHKLDFKKNKIVTLQYFDNFDYSDLSLDELTALILSWEEFFDKNKTHSLSYSAEEIEKEIKKQIEEWQLKEEFETTAQWQTRVNNDTRNRKINELKQHYLDIYENEVRILNEEQNLLSGPYMDYRSNVFARYYDQKIAAAEKSFSANEMELKPYDADNQTFLIHDGRYGDILLPVPIAEAQSFKNNWNEIKSNIVSKFVAKGKDVLLAKLVFHNDGNEYLFDSNTEASYTMVDINYNFEPIKIAELEMANLQIDNLSDLNQKTLAIENNSEKSLVPRQVAPSKIELTAYGRSSVDSEIPVNECKESSNCFAVIIGNENYQNVAKVPFAENDANIFSNYCEKTLGLPKKNIRFYPNATYAQLLLAVRDIQDIAAAYKGELDVIFYYAGHGIPDEATNEAYLLPVDANGKQIEVCYPLKRLYSELGKMGSRSVTVFMDACFSGSERGNNMLASARGVMIKPKETAPQGNMVIFAAASGDETAYPYHEKSHGLFTYYLLKKLQETKGEVTLGELGEFIIDNVSKESIVSNGKSQTPTVQISPSMSVSWKQMKLKK